MSAKNQNLQDDNVEYQVEVLRHSLPHCCNVFVGIGLHKPFYVLMTGPDNYSKTFEGEDLPNLLSDALEDSFQFKPYLEVDGTKTIEEVTGELTRLIKGQKLGCKARERQAAYIDEIKRITAEAEAAAEELNKTFERLNESAPWDGLKLFVNEIAIVVQSWQDMIESEEGDCVEEPENCASRTLTAEEIAELRRVSKGPEL